MEGHLMFRKKSGGLGRDSQNVAVRLRDGRMKDDG